MSAPPARVLAGIDLGTLTCRFLIAEVPSDGQWTSLYADRRILRLGEGLAVTRSLRRPAIDRVVHALREWKHVIGTFRVEGTVVVATSAVRDAENREEFLRCAKAESGFDIEVISGEEEARRTMLGIRSGLPSTVDGVLGIDIGGGSTEFILQHASAPVLIQSIDLGVVHLTEDLLAHDPPAVDEVNMVRDRVRTRAGQVKDALGNLDGVTLVGTAGSVTTLAAMAQRLVVYDPARVHNYELGLSTIRGFEEEFLSRSAAELRGLQGLEGGWEDVITAGTLVLGGIMETLGFTTCLVSDYGLREGIVIALAKQLAERL